MDNEEDLKKLGRQEMKDEIISFLVDKGTRYSLDDYRPCRFLIRDLCDVIREKIVP